MRTIYFWVGDLRVTLSVYNSDNNDCVVAFGIGEGRQSFLGTWIECIDYVHEWLMVS